MNFFSHYLFWLSIQHYLGQKGCLDFFLKAIRKLIGEFFGYHSSELTLKDSELEFFDCTTIHDRYINAAINIKKSSLIDQNLIGPDACEIRGM